MTTGESTLPKQRIEQLIQACQAEAAKSIESGDPPFGCVIVNALGEIVVRAHNTTISDCDITAHAEIKALRELGQKVGNRKLPGYILLGNAASCAMCMTAAIKAGIVEYYYGAPSEPDMDPALTMADVAASSKLNIKITGPILAEECLAQIIQGRNALTK